jgi:2-hydroxy-3-keto-5-methylthiopentenyl-1-phosphate phosphatase
MSDKPESTLPYPPLYKGKKFVVLSDWDGTITTRDSNDWMTDNIGYGKALRRQGNLDILSEVKSYRDGFQEMIDSVSAKNSVEDCKKFLRESTLLLMIHYYLRRLIQYGLNRYFA